MASLDHFEKLLMHVRGEGMAIKRVIAWLGVVAIVCDNTINVLEH